MVLASGNTATFVSVIGIAAGIWIYTPLHMNYWDEHSLSQAIGMAILGVCSYLLSMIAAAKINAENAACRHCAVGALVIIGISWLMAVSYPVFVVLFLVVLFIVQALWFRPLSSATTEKATDASPADVIAKYIVFLLAIDMGCIIWDYQVNTIWALYVSIFFIAAASGYYLKFARHSDRDEQTVYMVALVNFTVAALWPPYLLWVLHAVVAGFAFGYFLPKAVAKRGYQTNSVWTMGWTVWFFMGLALSNAWYANLQWAATRLMLLLPFGLLGVVYLVTRGAATKHH